MYNLSPGLIELNIPEGNGWLLDEEASTSEQTRMYYSRLLNAGETTPNVIESISIDPSIKQKVSETVTNNQDGSQTITTSYEYNGYQFVVEVKLDAAQENQAEKAIWDIFGRRVSISSNGTLSLQ